MKEKAKQFFRYIQDIPYQIELFFKKHRADILAGRNQRMMMIIKTGKDLTIVDYSSWKKTRRKLSAGTKKQLNQSIIYQTK